MNNRITHLFKGIATAAVVMLVYAVALGFFLALTLLVITMEVGVDSMSQSALPLTQAVVLLSQGSGFHTDSFSLTITPLMLTMLLIALIASLAKRMSTSVVAYVSGLVTWSLLNWAFIQGVPVVLNDSTWLVLLKTAVVYTIGFACAALPSSELVGKIVALVRSRISEQLRRTLRIGIVLGMSIEALYLLAGVIALIVWTILNYRAMGNLFGLLNMGTGSRILTTISTLVWLPNIIIWAVSWVFGGGFAIGELASFTLWTGQGSSMPPIPIFGLFPQAVNNDVMRMALLVAPLVICILAGLAALWFKRGFAVRRSAGQTADAVHQSRESRGRVASTKTKSRLSKQRKHFSEDDTALPSEKTSRSDESARSVTGVQTGFAAHADRTDDSNRTDESVAQQPAYVQLLTELISDFAYPVGAFCLAGGIVAVLSSLIFSLSNGALGTGRLAHVGVDVVASTQVLGRPTIGGLLAAWLISVIAVALVFAVRWAVARIRQGKAHERNNTPVKAVPRTSRSSASIRSTNPDQRSGIDSEDARITPRVVNSAPHSKEDSAE